MLWKIINYLILQRSNRSGVVGGAHICALSVG